MIRIAVYFSGHFRNFDQTWSQYKNMFQNTSQYSFDFYFGLWDIKDTNDKTPITESDILKVCPNARKIIILNSSIDHSQDHYKHDNHGKSVVNQIYGIYKTFNIVPDSYDYYMRMRTDLYFFDFNFLDILKTLRSKTNLILPAKVWYKEKNYPAKMVFNDYMWFSDYETAKYIASLYTDILQYNPTYLENLLAVHLSKKDFTIMYFDCCFNLDRRTRGEEMGLPESCDLTARRLQEGDFYMGDHPI